jgi:hypothetical protein
VAARAGRKRGPPPQVVVGDDQVVLRDEGPQEGSAPAWPWWVPIAAVTGGLLLLLPLAQANLELDHREPHQAMARVWLGVTLLVAAGWAALVLRGLVAARGVLAGAVGLALGFVLVPIAMGVATDYGREGGGFLFFSSPGSALPFAVAFYLVVLVVTGGVAGLLVGLKVPRWPGRVLTVAGIAVGASVAYAAVAMLVTFDEQVREAREANEASAAGALASAAVLLAMAAVVRRVRR